MAVSYLLISDSLREITYLARIEPSFYQQN